MRMNLSSQPGRHTVEIIMKCQTCVRARLRHLTWPINLGLIGLCHNKTEIHIQIQIQIQLQTQLQIQMQRRYTTSDIDVHSLLISPPFFCCIIYTRCGDGSSKFVIFTDGQVIDLAKSGGSRRFFCFCFLLASSLVDILSDSLIA